jgi:hypothetical protein
MSTAPPSPVSDGRRETQAYALTNAGTASGATSSTRHQPAPASPVRSTSQAQPTPTTAQAPVARTTRETVLRSSSPTRGRTMSVTASDQPWPRALTSTTTMGSTATAVTATAASTSSALAGSGRRRARAGARGGRVVVVTVR